MPPSAPNYYVEERTASRPSPNVQRLAVPVPDASREGRLVGILLHGKSNPEKPDRGRTCGSFAVQGGAKVPRY
jgi:hypothetical protein